MPQVGKYELVRKLATGGMAEVFLAKAAGPMGFEKLLVVKRILPHLVEDTRFVEMFLSEAKLAAQLNHHNVVQIFDFGESEGTYFIAMEYIDGPNLRTLSQRAVEAGTPIPFAHCAKLISLACDGLAYAHELADPETGEPLHLIHRDISPDNILLTRNGGVKVVDFGIAKARTQSHRTESGVLKGKIAYMSPEHLAKKPIDARADVYALGVVLYGLATGQKPFDAESEVELMLAAINDPIVKPTARRSDVPEELERIIEKALAKDREDRYQSCRELQAELEGFIRTCDERTGTYDLAQLVARLVPPSSAAGATRPTPVSKTTPASKTPASKATPPPAQAEPAAAQPRLRTKVLEAPAPASPPPPAATPAKKKSGGKPSRLGVAAVTSVALLALAGGGGYLAWRGGRAAPRPPPPASPIAESPPSATSTPPAAPAVAVTPASVAPAPPPATPRAPAEAAEAAKTDQTAKAAEPAEPNEANEKAGEQLAAAPQTASFSIESTPSGQVRINGRLVGTTPVQVKGIPAGKARIEVFGQGFSREEALALKPGDNGIKRITVQKGRIELRVRPYALVSMDGAELGTTPLPPVEVYEGRHTFRFVNSELKKDETRKVIAKPGKTTIVKIAL